MVGDSVSQVTLICQDSEFEIPEMRLKLRFNESVTVTVAHTRLPSISGGLRSKRLRIDRVPQPPPSRSVTKPPPAVPRANPAGNRGVVEVRVIERVGQSDSSGDIVDLRKALSDFQTQVDSKLSRIEAQASKQPQQQQIDFSGIQEAIENGLDSMERRISAKISDSPRTVIREVVGGSDNPTSVSSLEAPVFIPMGGRAKASQGQIKPGEKSTGSDKALSAVEKLKQMKKSKGSNG